MEKDSKGRLPGSSDCKKYKWGRNKKRQKIFFGTQQNKESARQPLDALGGTSRQSASSTPRITQLRVPAETTPISKQDSTRTTSSRIYPSVPASAQDVSTGITAEISSSLHSTTFDMPLALTSTARLESAAPKPVEQRGTFKTSKIPVAVSRSAMKLNPIPVESSNITNRIIDTSILYPQLQEILVCRACQGNITFSETAIRGLGFKICLTCSKCHKVHFINSSKLLGKKSNAYDINKRSVLATRALGQGLSGLKTFCGIMDLPKPVAHSYFDDINEQLKTVSQEVAQESMKAAVQQELDIQASNKREITVSGDGSWRKRGHSSLQGVSSLISHENGKIVDISIKHSFCRACAQHENDNKNSQQYQEWYAHHEPSCSANHQGSSGKMEVDGVIEMFERSETIHGVKYQNYIGDGDSKVYKAICESKPYGNNYTINKKECVGHVQKRMGTRLRNLKSSLSGKKLSDGKTIGGRGRLTAQVIDQLTKYYGNAIRSHCSSVQEMSNAIWATYYHKRSTDQEPQHHLCPKGPSSWCKWQRAKVQGNLTNFKHTSSIPPVIMDVIKPIYEDLTKEDLLERCLGGFTQNSNESFNNSIWKLVPKTSFSGLTVLEIGAYIAVLCYNDGKTAFLKLMEKFQLHPGSSAIEWAKSSDEERLFWAERKTAESTLESRRMKRKTRFPDEESYSAGAH